jgi:large subunit ribosomal protein L5
MTEKEDKGSKNVPDPVGNASEKKTAALSKTSKSSAKKSTGKKVSVKSKEDLRKSEVVKDAEADKKKPKAADTKKKTTNKKSVKKEVAAAKSADTIEVAEKKREQKKKKVVKSQKKKEYLPRLITKYKNDIIPAMMKQFNYSNIHQVPKIDKISINVGMGLALQNSKLLDSAVEDLKVITGQKPIVTKAKRSVSNFKLRIGHNIGCKVTVRNEQMYEFLDRLISIAIPRVRDFRGLSDKSFDGFGNYNIGIKEQIIFPEIDYDKVESIHGMDISIVTTASGDEEAYTLLKLLGMPFVERTNAEAAV